MGASGQTLGIGSGQKARERFETHVIECVPHHGLHPFFRPSRRPRQDVDAAATVGDEADGVSGGLPAGHLHPRDARSRRAHQRPDRRRGPPKWISNYDGLFKGLIPIREALAESRNAVAIWITSQIGIDAVLATSRSLGVQTPLQPYPTTALGASEVNLLELATAYRTIASGLVAQPYVIRRVVRDSGEAIEGGEPREAPRPLGDAAALSLIQEGLRGVVRIPTGTAHALDSHAFPIAVMGKTGTTNEFRDALFVGSTYGIDGVTVAVRIGFDDNRSLGVRETGGRVALPVFRELMLKSYGDKIVGPAPAFPNQMEQRITAYLHPDPAPVVATAAQSVVEPAPLLRNVPLAEWLKQHASVLGPVAATTPPSLLNTIPRQ